LSDTDSLDIMRMIDASENAILHAVLCNAAGGGLIAWSVIGPGTSPTKRQGNKSGRFARRPYQRTR